jgi:transposase
MDGKSREELIVKIEDQRGRRSKVLKDLAIPRSTYYAWRKLYKGTGVVGLTKTTPSARRIWNRLTEAERQRVLTIARRAPELSPRLLAVKITDEEAFSVSESTVYRILRDNDLIAPRPLPETPAEKQ